MAFTDTPARAPQRVRHALRMRRLRVQAVARPTPNLVRVTLAGEALEGFTSLGFDDHVKLFFPDPRTGELTLPTAGPDGAVFPPDRPRPPMRDYTPHGFDAQARTLIIDFALHPAGPATAWAEQAKVGDELGVGGPRGSFILPTDYATHLLIGDDTALPAIRRRLAELPSGVEAIVLVEAPTAQDHVTLTSAARLQAHWVYRDAAAHAAPQDADTPALLAALRGIALPTHGDLYAWVACESGVAKALRAELVGPLGIPPKQVKASGYWRRGSAATHDHLDGG